MSYRIHNLHFAYTSTQVLKGVSAEIQKGQFVALVGPNGAGKSTLLKIMAGILQRYDGTVEFDGRPLSPLPGRELAQRMAFVPQETHVIFPFRAGEIVLMGRLPHRTGGLFDSPLDVERARVAMEQTDTVSLAAKIFNELSGGERQRVVLASALAQDPEVLLLDEPTVYLDLKHQIQFYDILERLNVERGMTIVSVTHDINLAARYARRMIAIHDGVFAVDGIPDDVLTPERIYEIFEINAAVFKRPDGRGSYIVPSNS